eukprot:TRINITY_DN14802_c0_g1_i1.p1 TRINITY_DN14802_c0_g1~~TRINITY_DN14802_c0_g1_i1.p1  ORF type:complete len:187 (+),score=30.53 TRINITY_DN14802_c0_g1_i1:837-1397(+)
MLGGVTLLVKSKVPELSRYARIAGLAIAGLLFLTGLIGTILGEIGPMLGYFGIYSIILAPIVFAIQWPAPKVHDIVPQLGNFYVRAVAYALSSILTFFNTATIVAGVGLILLGGIYALAGFRGEKYEPPAKTDEEKAGKKTAGEQIGETEDGAEQPAAAKPKVTAGAIKEKVTTGVAKAIGKITSL